MALARTEIPFFVQDETGAVVEGALVQVNVRGGGSATIYGAETGGSTISNPITTGPTGRVDGWLAEGRYNLVVSGDDIATFTQPWDVRTGGVTSRFGDLNIGNAIGPSGEVGFALGADPGDTIWYRSAPAVTRTNGSMIVDGSITIGADTNLYRAAADTLATDDKLYSALAVGASVSTVNQVLVGNVGNARPEVLFGSALDTNLYRSAANALKTDDEFWASGGLRLADGLYTVNGVAPGSLQLGSAGDITFFQGGVKQHWMNGVNLLFGPAGDTNLYRSAANVLKTDDELQAVGAFIAAVGNAKQITLGADVVGGGQAAVGFGSANDTLLYRSGTNALATNGSLTAQSLVAGNAVTAYDGTVARIQMGNAAGIPTLYFGLAADTLLQRTAAGKLSVNGVLVHESGVIQMYAGAAAPTGWLLCDGSAVSRTTYATLFAVIGTTYGVGDGSTTFNLPDMRGRMPVGKGTNAAVDTLGDNEGFATANLARRSPRHYHSVQGNEMNIGATSATNAFDRPASAETPGRAGGFSFPFGGDQNGASEGPSYLTLNFIIKT